MGRGRPGLQLCGLGLLALPPDFKEACSKAAMSGDSSPNSGGAPATVSYKAMASCFRGTRDFASAGRGPAKLSWVFESLLQKPHVCARRVRLADLQELIMLEILDL